MRIQSSSRGWRWFSGVFLAVLVVYVVVSFAVAGIAWLTRGLAVLLLVGHLPLATMRFAYTDLTPDGLDLDVRVRRRHVPWTQVEAIELGGPDGRHPRVLLADGSELKSVALGGFTTAPHADPALLDRLGQAADTHGFTVTRQ